MSRRYTLITPDDVGPADLEALFRFMPGFVVEDEQANGQPLPPDHPPDGLPTDAEREAADQLVMDFWRSVYPEGDGDPPPPGVRDDIEVPTAVQEATFTAALGLWAGREFDLQAVHRQTWESRKNG